MRGRVGITAAATLAAAAVLGVASSAAAPLRSSNFQAFKFDVTCGVQLKQIGGMSCTSAGIPAKDLDGFIALGARGEAELGERGDSPWRAGGFRKLRTGQPWRRAGVTCKIVTWERPKLIRCLNADRNGFLLGPSGYELIQAK